MSAAFPALNNIESDGMLDIVNGLDIVLAKPQSHEIRARLEEDLAKQELGTPRLANTETNELPFLSRCSCRSRDIHSSRRRTPPNCSR